MKKVLFLSLTCNWGQLSPGQSCLQPVRTGAALLRPLSGLVGAGVSLWAWPAVGPRREQAQKEDPRRWEPVARSPRPPVGAHLLEPKPVLHICGRGTDGRTGLSCSATWEGAPESVGLENP